MFFISKKNEYLYDSQDRIENLEEYDKNIDCPIVIDTEFQDRQRIGTGWGRMGLTVQMMGINNNNPQIYDHPDLVQYCEDNNKNNRHKQIFTEFAPIDYLIQNGYKARFKEYPDNLRRTKTIKKLPCLTFVLYGHFLLAELFMICNGNFKELIVKLAKEKNSSRVFEMKRRIRTYTKYNSCEISDSIELNYFTIINNIKYRTCLKFIDTFALHGVASYKKLCEATGVELQYKDNFTSEEKSQMLQQYFERPDDFDSYSLGDLEVYKVLSNNAELFQKVWSALDILEIYKEPKLTIGATVRDIFKSVMYKHFNIENDEEKQKKLIEFCKYASASQLKTQTKSTECLLAKVSGGRCRNNRPTVSHLEGVIVDIDIAGCYGNGLRNQIYPIGKPIIESFPYPAKNNKYFTLRQWLKQRKYGKKNSELIDGLWTATVSTNENYRLKFEQDFLISWFDFKFEEIADMRSDTDNFELDINPKTGTTKILNNQVINAVITSDFVEWVYNICNPQQRKELLDNLYIQSACYYPAYSRINTLDELIEAWEFWGEENETYSKKSHRFKSGITIKIDRQPTYWIGLNLGELLIDDLLSWRKMYPKKTPLNTLFKLCVNTLYGIFCSPYFDISNSVVGNNITARARSMAWYMEKGFYGVQTITDGCQFDLKNVCYPKGKARVTAHNSTNLYRSNHTASKHIILKPLKSFDNAEIEYKDKKVILFKGMELIANPKELIDKIAFEHLQNLFPKVSVLHKPSTILKPEKGKNGIPIKKYKEINGLYQFETKEIYERGTFHGTANYLLENDYVTHIAMRSYESNKEHYSFEFSEDKDEIVITEYFADLAPSEKFLSQLFFPHKVKRSKVFQKDGILKLNDFKNNNEKWLNLGLLAGDTINKIGLLREFSISQFTYKNIEQLESIEKEVARNKRLYEQSYEGYFTKESILDFQEMIETVDKLIEKDFKSINKALDKNHNRTRELEIIHAEKEILHRVKEELFSNDYNEIVENEDLLYNEVIFDGDLDW